jgi:hypothetical protein
MLSDPAPEVLESTGPVGFDSCEILRKACESKELIDTSC